MLPKNYPQNKNNPTNNKSENKETAGVVLLIVFAFLLFCNVLGPFILGAIGSAIKNVIMGLIGYFSYPLYLCMITLGIFMMQGKKLSVKPKYAVALSIIFFSVISIIQLATTSGSMSDFNTYVDTVFHGNTIGGLLFGLIAYFLSTFLTAVGAYVVLAFVIVGALLIVAGMFDKAANGKIKKRRVNAKDFLAEVKPEKNVKKEPSLYIDNIMGTDPESMSFDSLRDGFPYPGNPNDNTYSKNYVLEQGAQQIMKEQDEAYDDLKRKAEDSRQKLFGDNKYYQDAFGPIGGSSSTTSSHSSYGTSSFDDYLKSSSSFFGADDYSSGGSSFKPYYGSNSSGSSSTTYGSPLTSPFSDVVPIPPEKQPAEFVNSSGIINGDFVSAGKTESESERNSSLDMSSIKNSFATETFGYNSDYNQKFINGQNDEEKPKLPPIINGDFVVSSGEDETPKFTATKQQDFVEKPEFPEFTPGPIIRGSNGTVIEAGQPVYMPEKEDKIPEFTQNTDKSNDYPITPEPVRSEYSPYNEYVASTTEPEDDPMSYLEESVLTEEDFKSAEGTFGLPEFPHQQAPIINAELTPEEIDNIVDGFDDLASDEESDEEVLEVEEYYAENDEALLDDEVFDYNDEESDDKVASQLDEYEKTYDHPKFEGVTEQESRIMNDNFEKKTSFIIEDEVIDQSENAKFNSVPSELQKPIITVADSTPKGSSPSTAVSKPKVTQVVEEKKTEPEKPKKKKPYKYVRPSLDLLTLQSTPPGVSEEQINFNINQLEARLKNLGVEAKVEDYTIGPAVTRYELTMPANMTVKRIEGMEKDIRYGLACKGQVRIESPIPGMSAVGVEMPNEKVAIVALRDILMSDEFKNASSPLTVSLGKDINGKVMVTNVAKAPHMLIAGTTGSGKSACIDSMIISIMYKASPDEVKFVLIDPKRVGFSRYNGMPHMLIEKAITEPGPALNVFKWLREEMERRYTVLTEARLEDIGQYNKSAAVTSGEAEKIPYIVVIVDEFADLMISSGAGSQKKELESLIASIAGKARAAGIHLILATQRPDANVVTGLIKSNLPTVIALKVANYNNSRIILDGGGAEALVGNGDMLFKNQSSPEETRIQGSYVKTEEVNSIVDFLKENNACEFSEDAENSINVKEEHISDDDYDVSSSNGGYDSALIDVVRMVLKTGQASGANILRRFNMGYRRATRIMDQMEELKFIGPSTGSKAREILITPERFREYFGEDYDNND